MKQYSSVITSSPTISHRIDRERHIVNLPLSLCVLEPIFIHWVAVSIFFSITILFITAFFKYLGLIRFSSYIINLAAHVWVSCVCVFFQIYIPCLISLLLLYFSFFVSFFLANMNCRNVNTKNRRRLVNLISHEIITELNFNLAAFSVDWVFFHESYRKDKSLLLSVYWYKDKSCVCPQFIQP